MMKKKIIINVIILICIMASQQVLAQAESESPIFSMSYSYDAAGNRISRSIQASLVSKRSLDSSNTLTPKDSSLAENEKTNTENSIVENAELEPRVYPTPTSDNLKVELLYNLNKLEKVKTKISLYDNKGSLLYDKSDATDKEEISLINQPPGSYYVVIKSDTTQYSYKIIKN